MKSVGMRYSHIFLAQLMWLFEVSGQVQIDFLFWPKCSAVVKRSADLDPQKCPYGGMAPPRLRPKLFPCDTKVLLGLLGDLQSINPDTVIKIANKENLKKLCETVKVNVKKTKEYMKTCSLDPSVNQFLRLFNGVKSLEKELCENKSFRKQFEEHLPCLSSLNSTGICAGPKGWAAATDPEKICKSYQSIVDCYFVKASLSCGPNGAKVMKELLNKALISVIAVKCKSFWDLQSSANLLPLPYSMMLLTLLYTAWKYGIWKL